jgi:hypothetical protein
MMRVVYEESEAALRDTWALWTSTVRAGKAAGNSRQELKQVQAKLASLDAASHDNAKKAMARIAGNNDGSLKALSLHAWMEFCRLYRQEKELEEAVKKTEQKLKKHLDSSKNERRQIMERMTGSTDTGLMSSYFKNWAENVKEERNARQMEEALTGNDCKFNMLNQRQKAGATKIQSRVNEQMRQNISQRVFSNWVLETKVNNLNRIFQTKYTSKKRQLQGVQNLFKSFAVQLDRGLDVEKDDDDGAPYTQQNLMDNSYAPSVRSGHSYGQSGRSGAQKHHGKHQHRGMVRDSAGSVSVPDVHSRHLLI